VSPDLKFLGEHLPTGAATQLSPSRLQRCGVFLSATALATAHVFRVTIKETAVCTGSSGREGRT